MEPGDVGRRSTLPLLVSGEDGEVSPFSLRVVSGPDAGCSWISDQATDGVATVGTHGLCSLVLADPTVSGFHCEIRARAGSAVVRDTGSLNGTHVDGVRVLEAHVKNGSLLRLGSTTLSFELGPERRPIALSEKRRLGRLIGESPAMRRVFALLERVAPTDTTVLLEGETGTGKSITAQTLHELGPRAAGPFVMIDCAAIPGNLLESELFGHERGAFTSADTRRIGAFEEASGGTLFLDEIGELPPALQPKLLGVLENRWVRRVGGGTSIPIDVRVIAATNRDLRAEVNAERFRSDLYFRLAVARIELPSLRRRVEDLEPLARHLLESLRADDARIDHLLTAERLTRLARGAWPGNIRELRNHLERCLVFDDFETPIAGDETAAPTVDASLPLSQAREQTIAEFERHYLRALLDRHGGRVADAAAAAQVDRTYLYRLLRRHGMRPS